MLRFLFGVLLPLVAWFVEKKTHICAQTFFDPLPGPIYSVLWLTIPASNAWILLARPEHRRGLGVLCGMAQVVAVVYTLWFLPLTLLSLVAIPFAGLGLCSLSPLLALPFCLTGLRSVSQTSRPPGRWLGVLLALLLMLLSALPAVMTYAGLQLARNPASRSRGLSWLRSYGDQQTLLEACYNQAGWTKSPLAMVICMGSPPPALEVRELFFRAYGTAFNDFPPPLSARRFLEDTEDLMVVDDPDQGLEKVGGRSLGLSLQQSNLAARVDSTGSTAQWNWDLTFANHDSGNREARCQVLLPPGAVACGAVLWVHEKPRQALIASRGKARLAYEAVVSKQRDPLLVTTHGPQRLLVQCFPVPAGGTMRIRLSMAAPLLQEGDSAWLKSPSILERNFEIQSAHNFQVDCPLPHQGLPATVPGTRLGSPLLWEQIKRTSQAPVWCQDKRSGAFTEAHWNEVKATPGPLWVVVDGSAAMTPYRSEIANALRQFRSAQPLGVVLAGDEVRTLKPLAPADAASMESAAHQVEVAPFEGGQDDLPALLAAKEGQVLWLHAGQSAPVDVGPLAPRANSILSLACTTGPNRVLEELGCPEAVRTGPIGVDIRRQLAVLSGQRPDWRRLQLIQSPSQPTAGLRSNCDDLSLLWAHAQPDNLKLAVRYGLVTPLTGAVVLENERQEREFGLRPQSEIPVVPEPATLALLASLGGLLLGRRALQRWR